MIILVSFIFLAKQVFALPLWAFAIGVGFAPISVFVFAILPEIVKPHEVGMGLGMLTVASNLGTTLGPTALGSILDLTAGKFFIAFTVLALVSLAAIVISLRLKLASSGHEG